MSELITREQAAAWRKDNPLYDTILHLYDQIDALKAAAQEVVRLGDQYKTQRKNPDADDEDWYSIVPAIIERIAKLKEALG